MKEIREIIAQYDGLLEKRSNLALATVFDVKGSSYRRTGARMLIQDNGKWTGGISGGCIEGNALKQANLVMMDHKSRVVTYDTENDDESSIGVSLGCNGIISVLFSRIDPDNKSNQIEILRGVSSDRSVSILITVIKSNNDSLNPGRTFTNNNIDEYIKDLTLSDALKQAVNEAESKLKSTLFEYNNYSFFIEYIVPDIKLIIMGGNYDVYPLLSSSKSLGWNNIIVYNSKRLFDKAFPLADEILEDFPLVDIDEYTVGVIMSHDYNADLNNLRKAADSNLRYIGLLGPAVRKQDMLNVLETEGVEIDESRIFGPAGLDIGASQPEEIAVSIISEIISVMRNRDGGSLRMRNAPIHER